MPENDFTRAAATPPPGFFLEFASFLRAHRAWWLVPIVVGLLAFGALVLLSTSAAAPFIYTLF